MNKIIEPLPYSYSALEPYIDEQTMRIHHDKHHQTYFDKYQKALENTEWQDKEVTFVLKNIPALPESIRAAAKNHGGGHYHHSFFWSILKKDVSFQGDIAEAIKKRWGSFEKFREEFTAQAMSLFGSGWTWLVHDTQESDPKKKLKIINISNQDSPISEGKFPLLCLDLWEHAYYLKYQNRRAEYIDNFWKIINWKQVDKYLKLHAKI